MRKLWVLVGLVGLLCAPALQAATVTVNRSPYSAGNGGEFQVVPNAGPGSLSWVLPFYSPLARDATSFQTFCIETSEFFNPGATYNATISGNAMYGGQPPNGDPISIGTAWLYSQFAAGTLANYDFNNNGVGRTVSAGALQDAIWWLEGEAGDPGAGNTFRQAVIAAYVNAAAAMVGANGAFGVRALNLWDVNTGAVVQDQLVIVPEPTTMIAGALLLLPFGVSTLRILRKKHTA